MDMDTDWASQTKIYADCQAAKRRARDLCVEADVTLGSTTMGTVAMMEADDYVPAAVGLETNRIAGLVRDGRQTTSRLPGYFRAEPPQVVACQSRNARVMTEELALYGCPTFEKALAMVIGRELDLRQPLLLTEEMVEQAQEYVRAYRRNVLNKP